MCITEEFNSISHLLYHKRFNYFGHSQKLNNVISFRLNYCGIEPLTDFKKDLVLLYFNYIISLDIDIGNDIFKSTKTYEQFKDHLLNLYFSLPK